jgi:hypothetical protein
MKTMDDQGEVLTEDEVNDLLDDERDAGWHNADAYDWARRRLAIPGR